MEDINLLRALSDNIVIDKDKCVYCGICINTCILDNLRMNQAPCRTACPLNVNVQGYVQQIARGDDDGARRTLRFTMVFPEILGRICPQPCEEGCHHGHVGDGAVAIRALKRYLVDGQKAEDIPLPKMAPDSGKSVAIVGSGPAGLNAAHDLRTKGHAVTIFEAASEPGGLMRWAVPEFRLPVDVLEKELSLLPRMGIDIRCGVRIGTDMTIAQLKKDFDAVVLAAGCGDFARLEAPGTDLAGVYEGLPFLRSVRAGEAPAVSGRAVIIGGGCVAVEAAQTALRLGADSATIVCLEGPGEMPAFRWSQESAHADGVAFDYGWGPVEIQAKDGRAAGVKLQRCLRVKDADGVFNPTFNAADTRDMAAETVIIAIGQARDESCLEPGDRDTFLDASGIKADALTLQSEDHSVFVAGDFYTGPTSVVKAMANGRQAAESVDRYLTGEHMRYGRTYAGPIKTDFDIDTSRGSDAPRTKLPTHPFTGKGDFSEIETTLSESAARAEANRCYSCGQPTGYYRTCWFCLPCEVECPHEALWVEIPYLSR
jgi:NADPH-dependent glutamate synthase beta subunit-like oxidoreductase